MITLEEACRIAYEDRLRGTKYTRIKDAGDSYIICFAKENGEIFTVPPYRISKANGERLPFAIGKEFFDMFDSAEDVEVPEEFRCTHKNEYMNLTNEELSNELKNRYGDNWLKVYDDDNELGAEIDYRIRKDSL